MARLCKTFDALVCSVSAVQNAADALMEELHAVNTHVYMLLESPPHADLDLLKRTLADVALQISALSALAEEPDEALAAVADELEALPAQK